MVSHWQPESLAWNQTDEPTNVTVTQEVDLPLPFAPGGGNNAEEIWAFAGTPQGQALGVFLASMLWEPADIFFSALDYLQEPSDETALWLGLSLLPGAARAIVKLVDELDAIRDASRLVENAQAVVRNADEVFEVIPKGGDQFRDLLGSALDSTQYGDEVADMINQMEDAGVEIIWREGQYGYNPNGPQLVMDPEASISAWRHEFQHFRDHRTLTPFTGTSAEYRALIEDPSRMWDWELRAYMREIDLARQLNQSEIENDIIDAMLARKDDLVGSSAGEQAVTREDILQDIADFERRRL